MRPVEPRVTVFGVSADVTHTSVMEQLGKLTSDTSRAIVVYYVAARFKLELRRLVNPRNPTTRDGVLDCRRRRDRCLNRDIPTWLILGAIAVGDRGDNVRNSDERELIPLYWWRVNNEGCGVHRFGPQVELFGIGNSHSGFGHD